MFELEDIGEVDTNSPKRFVIYGPPGIGKTSFAAEFPAPIFIQTEDGQPAGARFKTFTPSGKIQTWEEVSSALRLLAKKDHAFETIVIDSIDKLEPLIWAHVCQKNGWDSIESPGYGRGYVEADALWYKLFEYLDYLRNSKNMTCVLIGHSAVVSSPNPSGQDFPKWDIRLHKRAHGIVEDSVDAILLLLYDLSTGVDKKSSDKKTKSANSNIRWIHCNGGPAFNAKNRLGLPNKIIYNEGQAYLELSKHIHGEILETSE